MKKTLLEMAEKTMSVTLSVSSTIGMFLMGVFLAGLVFDMVSTEVMWVIFLGSLILTYGFTKLLTVVKWKLYNILVDEMEFQEDAEAYGLYKHLEVK
jgi:hypothetical protein